ncbi:MAG: SocA family protein [Bacteroidales bacterium]|nr:SocA family protein [Bacteroidales bacterium]
MRTEELQTLKAVILYIINHSAEDKRDVYGIVKTAFFAQQRHFVMYGLPLFCDEVCALPFGPVPSQIYDILKIARGDSETCQRHRNDGLADIADTISFAYERYDAKEEADMDWLSVSNIDCLDYAINYVGKLSFQDIYERTHDSEEYLRARNTSGRKVMDDLAIASEGGADEATIRYLQEHFEIRKALA